MPRIERRRYNKPKSSSKTAAEYLIKTGGLAGPETGFEKNEIPKNPMLRFRGFVIFKNNHDLTSEYPVDWNIMHRLVNWLLRVDQNTREAWGCASVSMDEMKKTVATAMKQQLKAKPYILPHRLEFAIPARPKAVAQGWEFGGLYSEEYMAFKLEGCKGLFCKGDGIYATRWTGKNMPKKKIFCNPAGAEGVEDVADYCEYSVNKSCSPVGTFSLMLMVSEPDASGREIPVLLSPISSARFLYATKSERTMAQAVQAFEEAADRLNGDIAGLPGALQFKMKNALTPEHGNQPTMTVEVQVDQIALEARERMIRSARLVPSEHPQIESRQSLQIAYEPEEIAEPEDEFAESSVAEFAIDESRERHHQPAPQPKPNAGEEKRSSVLLRLVNEIADADGCKSEDLMSGLFGGSLAELIKTMRGLHRNEQEAVAAAAEEVEGAIAICELYLSLRSKMDLSKYIPNGFANFLLQIREHYEPREVIAKASQLLSAMSEKSTEETS